jgi:hypothetical protein
MLRERRAGPRIVPEGTGWVGYQGIFLRTKIVNLSVSGALVEGVIHDLPVGATITLRCHLGPDELEVEGDAIVRARRPGGLMAVQFQGWTHENESRLAALIDVALDSAKT